MHPALQGSSCVQGYGLGGPTGGCPTASAITCTCEHLGKKESYLKAEPYQSECETHTEWLSYPVSLLSLCLWVENGESVSVPWKARCPQVQCNVNGKSSPMAHPFPPLPVGEEVKELTCELRDINHSTEG